MRVKNFCIDGPKMSKNALFFPSNKNEVHVIKEGYFQA